MGAVDRITLTSKVSNWVGGLVSFVRSKIPISISISSRIGEGYSPDCLKLSTLLLCGNWMLKFIPESFFCKMQGLCTLDMGGNPQIAMLPDSISDLTCLKSLHLENCQKLEKVPYLGKLKALRELNLSGTAIKEAPQGLEELCNLKFLSMTVDGLKMLPKGLLLKLRHLEHLKLPLHIQVEIEEINNLKQLEQFIGVNLESGYGSPFGNETDVGGKANELVLWESNLKEEKVLGKGIVFLTIRDSKGLSKWLVDGLSERFDNPTSLRKLQVSRCGGIEWILRSDGQASQITNTLEVMELHRLDDLKGVVVMQRPAQLLVFSSLKNLVIYRCDKMRKLGFPVSAVPNLEKILIKLCIEMQEIFEDEEEGRRASGSVLPRLKELRLYDLPRLKSVSEITIISNSIQTILIKDCPELMKKLPLRFDDPTPPPSLREITVKGEWWESLEWEFNSNLPRLLQPFLQFLL